MLIICSNNYQYTGKTGIIANEVRRKKTQIVQTRSRLVQPIEFRVEWRRGTSRRKLSIIRELLRRCRVIGPKNTMRML